MPGLAYNSRLPALALSVLWACGGAPPPSTADRYRQLRTAEAELERSARSQDCSAGGGCVHEVCGAADEICEIAEALGETDAALRCEAAQRRCTLLQGAGPAEGP